MFGKKKNEGARMMNLFAKAMDDKGIKYTKHDEDPVLFIRYRGDNFEGLTFTFIFDEDGTTLSVKVYSIVKFKESQLADAYAFANEMNTKYRWIKMYVDNDNELTAAMDAVITEKTVGEECLELLFRAVSIVDDVYKALMA